MSAITFSLSAVFSLLVPSLALGQTTTEPILAPIPLFLSVVDIATVFIVTGAIVVFLFGFIRGFTVSGDHEKEHHDAGLMTKSVLAILLVVTLWGVLNYAASFLGFSRNVTEVPTTSAKSSR